MTSSPLGEEDIHSTLSTRRLCLDHGLLFPNPVMEGLPTIRPESPRGSTGIHRPEHGVHQILVYQKSTRSALEDSGSGAEQAQTGLVSDSGNCSAIGSYNLYRVSSSRPQRSDHGFCRRAC